MGVGALWLTTNDLYMLCTFTHNVQSYNACVCTNRLDDCMYIAREDHLWSPHYVLPLHVRTPDMMCAYVRTYYSLVFE